MDTKKNTTKQVPDRFYYLLGLRVAADFGVIIAMPALTASYFGKKLDLHFGSSPWLLIICFTIALIFTIFIAVKKAKYYAELYEQGPRN